jgi:hypothetical protein
MSAFDFFEKCSEFANNAEDIFDQARAMKIYARVEKDQDNRPKRILLDHGADSGIYRMDEGGVYMVCRPTIHIDAIKPAVRRVSRVWEYGTTVHLYWYSGSWQMSTIKGYDVSNYTFLSNKTFREMLAESTGDWLNLDTLNKEFTHTILFRHPDLNGEVSPSKTGWHIASKDNITGDVDFEGTKSGLSNVRKLPIVQARKAGYYVELAGGHIHVHELDSHKFLRLYVFNMPKDKTINSAEARLKFIAVQALCNPRCSSTILGYVPGARKYFVEFSQVLKTISKNIITRARRVTESPLPAFQEDLFQQLQACRLLHPDNLGEKIIKDFICDPRKSIALWNYLIKKD